ncbi:hypothetical protein H0H81_009051 [Sphagnurus paluster]|uniref:Uncharacterized protein n=1 Tax=Sphagnurus paluster TaxID=117069 RepID=A0A9P7K4H1_9AGAR|nr:hypothetical protein H0H81_009051 [Sphagnurus paluster]
MDIPPSYSTPAPALAQPSSSSEPPSYPANDPPPSYDFPETFTIGQKRTVRPLVSSQQVKGHLALLHAFVMLRTEIDTLDDNTLPFIPTDTDRRWAWFVGLAVERFSLWCGSLTSGDSRKTAVEFLPPVDVLMVWHAYMLNPWWYAEDCLRVPTLRHLAEATPIFSSSLAHNLESILAAEPSQERRDSWYARTGKAFEPLEDAQRHLIRDIRCPKCRGLITIPYMNAEGTGYLQQNFQAQCPRDGCYNVPKITKAVLGARKLAENLARDRSRDEFAFFLAGTIHTPQTHSDLARGALVKQTVLGHSRFKRPNNSPLEEDWVVSMLEKNLFRLDQIRAAMANKMRAGGGKLLARIFTAYTDGEMFSVDLVGAVIRQGSFVKKMNDLQWTEPGFFDTKEDEVALQHAIARYHAFLDLMAASPVAFHVPTLDIDLAWHTHQLLGKSYNDKCMTHVGRYIDHDDKVEERTLSSSFDVTCRAWKERFNIPYTHCGCPLPGQTIGQRLSRLVQNYKLKPSYLIPPAREDLLAATHPSDHNAVFVFQRKHAGEAAQARRRAKFQKRQAAFAKAQAKRRDKEGNSGKKAVMTPEERRAEDERMSWHSAAFLVPVPLYYGYGYAGACAAYAGNVVYAANPGGAGGCAVTFWEVSSRSIRILVSLLLWNIFMSASPPRCQRTASKNHHYQGKPDGSSIVFGSEDVTSLLL